MPNPPTLDVAIIGGGVAGLGTAYHLRDSGLAVQVFERNHVPGGRARAVEVAGDTVSLATAFVYSGTETERMCNELGIEFEPVEFEAFGYYSQGTTTIAPNDEALIHGLPMSEEGKKALWDVLRRFREEYDTYAGHGLTDAADELAGVSLKDYLGPLPQEVYDFLAVIALGGSMARPDELSAKFGLRYVASYLLRDPEHRNMIRGGLNRIPQRLVEEIPSDVVLTGAEISRIEPAADGYRIEYALDGNPSTANARHLVLALQPPVFYPLLSAPLPGWKRDALDRIPFSPYVGVHAVLSPGESNPWAGVLVVFPEGLAFNLLLHQTLQLRKGRLASEPSTLHMYSMREDAARLLNRDDDEQMVAEWLEDLYRVYPDARGRVIGQRIIKWPYSWPYIRAWEASHLEAIQRPVANTHFAGDWTTNEGATYGALGSARRVAGEILGRTV